LLPEREELKNTEKLDYEREVEKEAKEFLSEHADDVVKQLVGFEDELSDELRFERLEETLDREYTPEDAIFVLDNSQNEETDSGLWEGKDWRDELSIRAAFTYINDVRSKVEEIYKEMYEEFESAAEELNPDGEDHEQKLESLAKNTLSENTEKLIEQVKPGSQEEKEILSEWIRLSKNAGTRGSYPLGGSYIDARCGVGFGMPDQYEYVMTDRKVAKQLPHLAGKYRDAIEKYYQDTFGDVSATC
jgi:hypothetical protein